MKALMFDHICGVYFLLDQETIVYVGQSLNVMARLSDHRREGQKQFNRIFVVECKIGELTHLEALYIDKFKPIYNLARPAVNPESTAWDASLSDLLRGAVYEQN